MFMPATQSEAADHHREPGEDDGARQWRPRGDRLPQLHSFGELGFVAGDDEQGVVDPDSEADHRRQRGGDLGASITLSHGPG